MTWHIVITKEAWGDLKKLDGVIYKRIVQKLNWFQKYFPDVVPLPLSGSWRGFLKLRVGDWRIIYEVDHQKKYIFIHLIDHRKKIYKHG